MRKRNKWRSLVTGKDRPQMLGGPRRYSRATCLLLNIFDPRVPCKYGCKWVAPFGWLRNPSCRKHD